MSIDAGDRAAVAHFIRVCGSGVVATVGADGEPQAAYVGLTVAPDGAVLFDAPTDSRKVGNIEQRPRVAIAVTGADTTLQIEGRARITWDDERTRLGEEYARHFPDSRALDDGFTLLAVEIDWVRVYDAGVRPARVSESRWDAAS
ncbi:pyridoxamine 5'-phosphate oxidase family protein [Microbacterium sp. YJN-G]|uniref:pyridoxamine 5'-phosphate oxidase family protein n=1 Tax=Microbacterium sp. YJN-G TaxID=2763257 RepID=UPI001878EAC2|nr:pyridoxamine 5'-phosphate oxidase family protein [Microbacterium sp. YJN-G]